MHTPGTDGINRYDKFLGAIATRAGIVSVLGLLIGVCLVVGLFVQSSVKALELDHAVLQNVQVRNGFVAMSDISRLVFAGQATLQANEITPELKAGFVEAADVLYVRVDNFRMVMQRSTQFESSVPAIEALDQIVEIADTAIANGFSDPTILVQELLIASDEARRMLVQFLDEARRQNDRVLALQLRAVNKQQVVVFVSLAGLALFGTLALLFLRREVLGRLAREHAEKRVNFLAFFDPLTELPNRVQFQDRLRAILDIGKPVSVLFIDLDDFKMINDTYGHATGDTVLHHVGTILAAHASKNDGFAARLAGDEFAMLVQVTIFLV